MIELKNKSLTDFRFWIFKNKGLKLDVFNKFTHEKQLGYYLEFFKGIEFIESLKTELETEIKNYDTL